MGEMCNNASIINQSQPGVREGRVGLLSLATGSGQDDAEVNGRTFDAGADERVSSQGTVAEKCARRRSECDETGPSNELACRDDGFGSIRNRMGGGLG